MMRFYARVSHLIVSMSDHEEGTSATINFPFHFYLHHRSQARTTEFSLRVTIDEIYKSNFFQNLVNFYIIELCVMCSFNLSPK